MNGSDHEPIADERSTTELSAGFTLAALAVFSAGGVEGTLRKLVEVTVGTIEGCDAASISLLDGPTLGTHVETDPIGTQFEALQRSSGEGPSLDVVSDGGSIYVGDLAEDVRWPHFGPAAETTGIRSMLSLSISSNGTLGVLSLFARYPRAFGVIDRAKALVLGALASLAISEARTHEDEARRADDLRAALATREVIGQAQGILMERERITADQAFDILRRASQHLNRKLREVAQDLVESGERPETGSSPAAT